MEIPNHQIAHTLNLSRERIPKDYVNSITREICKTKKSAIKRLNVSWNKYFERKGDVLTLHFDSKLSGAKWEVSVDVDETRDVSSFVRYALAVHYEVHKRH